MTNNVVEIRKALFSGANEFLTGSATIVTVGETFTAQPTLDPLAIAWPNRNFDPARRGLWASVFYVPNIPEGVTVGQRGQNQITGFLQIDLNAALDAGESVLLDWQRKAGIFFHGGRVFSYNAARVLVVSAGTGQGRTVDNFFRKSITVTFRARLKRVEVT